VPTEPAAEYRVKVQMEAGPFKVDSDYESILKSADWRAMPEPAGESR